MLSHHDTETPSKEELENLCKLSRIEEDTVVAELKDKSSKYLKHVWFSGFAEENINLLRCCIKAGLSTGVTTATGKTLLHVAVEKNKINIINWLIAESFNLDYQIKLKISNKAHSYADELELKWERLTAQDSLMRAPYQIKTKDNKEIIDFLNTLHAQWLANIEQLESSLEKGKNISDNNNDKSKKIILVDVDDTIVNSSGQYNTGLIQALKMMQQKYPETKIILTTSYQWGENLIQKAVKGLTRLAVKTELEKQGLRINAIVISGSNQYPEEKIRLGSYYKDCFMNGEKKILTLTDRAQIKNTLMEYQHIAETDKNYIELNIKDRKIERKTGSDNKEPMLRHILDHFGKEAKYLIFDDNAEVHAAVRWFKANEKWSFESMITTVQANLMKLKTDNTAAYCKKIEETFELSPLSKNALGFSLLSWINPKTSDNNSSQSTKSTHSLGRK